MNADRPVTDPAALRFLEARIDESDEHDAAKRSRRLELSSLWTAQQRDDAAGVSARLAVRSMLRNLDSHEDLDPSWLGL